jgi:hypothetical protein
MFNGMLRLSTNGILNMVSKQLRNVSTQKSTDVNEFISLNDGFYSLKAHKYKKTSNNV